MTIQLVKWWYYLPADSYTLNVTAGASTESLTVDTSARNFWPIGGGASEDLFTVIETALETHTQISTATLSLQTRNSRIVTDVAASIDWAAGTLPSETLGWTDTTTPSGTTTDSPNECAGFWNPGRNVSEDTRDRIYPVAGSRMTIDGQVKTTHFANKAAERRIAWTLVTRDKALSEYASYPAEAIERGWLQAMVRGGRFELYDDAVMTTLVGTYQLKMPGANPIMRDPQYDFRWRVAFDMVRLS